MAHQKKLPFPDIVAIAPSILHVGDGRTEHRFVMPSVGESGLNYLCEGFKDFNHHADPSKKRMARLIQVRILVQKIMEKPSSLA